MNTTLARKSPPPLRGRTEEDRQRGLLVLALCGGSAIEASRRLKEQGTPVPKATLEFWRDTNPERYHEIQQTHSVEIGRSLAAKQLALAHDNVAVEDKALRKLEDKIDADELKATDLSTTVRNLAVSRKVSTDGSLQLEGRPTSIVEHRRDLTENIEELNKIAPGLFVDSTAEEIEP